MTTTTTIFIITVSSGAYSDYSCDNVCVAYSEKAAQNIVALLNAAAKYDSAFIAKQRQWQNHWWIDNPKPIFLNGKTNGQKERMSSKDMTLKKAEFKDLNDKWSQSYVEDQKVFDADNYDQPAETMALMKRFNIKPGSQNDSTYNYGTIEVLDSQEDE